MTSTLRCLPWVPAAVWLGTALGLSSCQTLTGTPPTTPAPLSRPQTGKPTGLPAYTRREVIYGRTWGTALTMDVFTPVRPANGAAILLAVSEGWYSEHEKIEGNIPVYVEPMLARGYTVFAVVHGSNPKFALPEILEQLHRAVRFIRHQAPAYGLDPERIGSTGDSAGGYLALMLGSTGRPANPAAPDSVDQEPSRIRAAVAFFPPTDFLNWGALGRHMLGQHPIVPLTGAFAFSRLDTLTNSFQLLTDPAQRVAVGRQVSPITHVSASSVPTLLVHGDQDVYIPLQQSERMAARLTAAGVPARLLVMPGGAHDAVLVRRYMPDALAWFDRYLLQ